MSERRRTFFWAVKMQFMMGTYCALESCVTLRTTMRGRALRDAADEAKASVAFRRLMSAGGRGA